MAVYTEVSDAELTDFLSAYDLGAVLAFKGIAEGVENSNFYLQTESGSFILTIYEKRVRKEDLPFFLSLMDYLAVNGVTCPQPVRDRSGKALGSIAGRAAVLVTFLEGLWIRRPEARHCAALGAALARLHQAGAAFPMKRENSLSVSAWRPLFAQAEGRADEVQQGLADLIEQELDALERLWPKNLPAGIIHADLFPDNVFFLGARLSGIIDFYFACTDFFAYDLVICMNSWCFEPDASFNVTKARALMQAYKTVRPLEAFEVTAFPVLARGASLRFLLTRLIDWLNVPKGALVRPKDPLEYAKKLRFHQRIGALSDYGLGE